jgi:Molydopterin dinucleotide binding domain
MTERRGSPPEFTQQSRLRRRLVSGGARGSQGALGHSRHARLAGAPRADAVPTRPRLSLHPVGGPTTDVQCHQIFRDPAWRRDDPDGALLINPLDLIELGVESDGWMAIESAKARLLVRCKANDSMRRGHVVLPHGFGQAYPAPDGERLINGSRINLLTSGTHRDPIAGTPYHKHVNVRPRLRPAPAAEALASEARSRRIHAVAGRIAARAPETAA